MRFGTSITRSALALAILSGSALAQVNEPVQLRPDPVPQSVTAPAATVTPPAPTGKLSAEQLNQLTGSIALYPDPLVAQILPASTFPTDIVLAARMVARSASAEEIDRQNWDPSVKAVAHYPTVIKMMSDNLEWTTALGEAFMKQPEDVMASIQALRVKAQSLGNLQDTPQQKVLIEDTVVRIVPAVPEVVYVPVYQPSVVYYTPCVYPSSFISFGFGYHIGPWLFLDCDWHRRCCYRPVHWNWCNYRWGVTNISIHIGDRRGHRFDGAPGHVWTRDNRRGGFADRTVARPAIIDGEVRRFDRPRDLASGLTSGPKTPGISGGSRRDSGVSVSRPNAPVVTAPGVGGKGPGVGDAKLPATPSGTIPVPSRRFDGGATGKPSVPAAAERRFFGGATPAPSPSVSRPTEFVKPSISRPLAPPSPAINVPSTAAPSRSFTMPRSAPPAMSAPRSFAPAGPTMTAPRSFSAPSTPAMSAPRSFSGGGGKIGGGGGGKR